MNQRNRELTPSFSRPPSRVMIRKAGHYEEDLRELIYESLREFRLPVNDKTVLLKPNLVGLDPEGVMNTNPAVIAATREAFLKLGPCAVHRMSFPVIHEMLGEYTPDFYALRAQLFASGTRDALDLFEAALKASTGKLTEPEYRKLRLLTLRRWKLVAA